MRYRSRPRDVEATQWLKPGDHPYVLDDPDGWHYVAGEKGLQAVEPGDWICQHPRDASLHYVIEDTEFRRIYEPYVLMRDWVSVDD